MQGLRLRIQDFGAGLGLPVAPFPNNLNVSKDTVNPNAQLN